jgi:hypothetical protein
MIEAFRKHRSETEFLNDGRAFKIKRSSDYISYPEFLAYFKNIGQLSRHNVIIGINFTYGWMPTMFEFMNYKMEILDDSVGILQRAKSGSALLPEELHTLIRFFNNSLVGTSKLLHFVNPEKFAIWDSRVYHYLTGDAPHFYRLSKGESFFSYLAFCEERTKIQGYEEVHKRIVEIVGYDMSKYRTAELIMYSWQSEEK